jgi:hypothetical protein
MDEPVKVWVAFRTATGRVADAEIPLVPAEDRNAGDFAVRAAAAFDVTASRGRLELFRLAPREGAGKPTHAELDKASEVDKGVLVSNRDIFSAGAWFRLDVIDINTPQTGKSNPHARDTGARAWRETETPLRFRRPLVRRRRRPLSLTLSPPGSSSPPFGIAGGPVGAGAGSPPRGLRAHLVSFSDPPNSLMSPSTDSTRASLLKRPGFAFLGVPATLQASAGALDCGRVLARFVRTAVEGVRDLGEEKLFYLTATANMPAFANAVGQPGGKMDARSLYGDEGATTPLWHFPMDCFPELLVRSRGGEGNFRPCWNGELKSSGRTAIDQAVTYTVIDMVRVFFPNGCPRRFFSLPPVGYAVVGYPHVGYVLAMEWIGVLMVSVVSEPFVLGTDAHRMAVEGLEDVHYDPPTELGSTGDADWLAPPLGHPLADRISWRLVGGRFQKLLRYDARSPESFHMLARVYLRLQTLISAAKPPAVMTDARALFGLHEVMIEMEAVPDARDCKDAELESDELVVHHVSRAMAWLASKGILYTDIRGPNVLVSKTEGSLAFVKLVDYDDCLLCDRPIVTKDDFLGELRRYREGDYGRDLGVAGGAEQLLEGGLKALAAALDDAFKELPVDG